MKKKIFGTLVAVMLVGTLFVSCRCNKNKAMYEAIPVGVIVADADGKIANANKPMLDMLGYTLAELKALTWQEITPQKWHSMENEMAKIAMEQPYVIYDKAYTKKDGSILPIQIIGWVKTGEDGKIVSSGGIVRPLIDNIASMGDAAPVAKPAADAPAIEVAPDTTNDSAPVAK